MVPPEPRLEDYRWLAEGDGAHWLERTAAAAAQPVHQIANLLRKDLTERQTSLLLHQHALRQRARGRFPQADQMLWTDKGLNQASSWRLAVYKADRFVQSARVLDLCCGIGGDLLALAQQVDCGGVDQDPICVFLANYHLNKLAARHQTAATVASAETVRVAADTAVHIDPDRRPDDRRSIQLQHHRPGEAYLRQLVAHPAGVGVKLAPATDANHPLLQDAELEWLGHGRECSQLVAWFGPLARYSGRRRATLISNDGQTQSLTGEMDVRTFSPPAAPRSPARFIVEPHAPILASGLARQLAVEHNLAALTDGCGYLTGDHVDDLAWWQRFEVIDVAPFREKRLARWLASHQIGLLEVKKRGVRIDPLALQRQFSRRDGQPATLFVMPRGAQRIAVLARRCG